MLKLAVVKISEDANPSLSLSLPLSAIDYINKTRGNASFERAAGMRLLATSLKAEGVDDFKIGVSREGKPYLVGNKLYFSISHSGGLCALALSDKPCGIDLQDTVAVEKIADRDRFAKRYFAPDELAVYKDDPTADTLSLIWTRKEALAKLLGLQLNSALSGLSSYSRRDVSFDTRRAEIDGKTFYLTVATQNKKKSKKHK